MILILGSGLLGSELNKLSDWHIISRKQHNFDINDLDTFKKYLEQYDTIVNCVGFTDTYSIDRKNNWDVNFESVAKLSRYLDDQSKKLVQISTDYVYSNSRSFASEDDVPVHCANWYGYTKLLGDGVVQLMKDYLVIRCSFKPKPFPYPKAVINQIGNFDYVDGIAKKIIELVERKVSGVVNVGTDVKTIYTLAEKTRDGVLPMSGKIHSTMPTDITMNCNKMWSLLDEQN
jgi:dTDP-4-dehydrorhamnose reductase